MFADFALVFHCSPTCGIHVPEPIWTWNHHVDIYNYIFVPVRFVFSLKRLFSFAHIRCFTGMCVSMRVCVCTYSFIFSLRVRCWFSFYEINVLADDNETFHGSSESVWIEIWKIKSSMEPDYFPLSWAYFWTQLNYDINIKVSLYFLNIIESYFI